MDHSYLISKGIYPKKFILDPKFETPELIDEKEKILEDTHPAYAKLIPLFSLHSFLKVIYPTLPQRKMIEKYLQDHIITNNERNKLSEQSQVRGKNEKNEKNAKFSGETSSNLKSEIEMKTNISKLKNNKLKHSKFDLNTFFKHEIPFFQDLQEEYLLTIQQLYTLFFRIMEREFTPELQEMREYLMNRQIYEYCIMKNEHSVKKMESKVLAIVTSVSYVDRILNFLKTEIDQLKKEHALLSELNNGDRIQSSKSFFLNVKKFTKNENTVEVHFNDTTSTSDLKNFVKYCIAPHSWKRNIQLILVLTHVGRNIFNFLDSIDEDKSNVRVQCHPKWLQMDICRDIEILFDKDQNPNTSQLSLYRTLFKPNRYIQLSPQNFNTIIEGYITESGEIAVGLVDESWWNFILGILDVGQSILPTHDLNNIEICSKAYFKLDEIISTDSRLKIFRENNNFIGVDIGASPGGWSQVMTRFCSKIYAVDPGLLDEELLSFYNQQIVHVHKKAEEFIYEDLAIEFKNRNDTPFIDFLCCDMNVDPKIVAQILKPFSHFMKSGSFIVMTLKLIKHATEEISKKKFDESIKVLETEFKDFRCHWLFANTANERTLVAEKI